MAAKLLIPVLIMLIGCTSGAPMPGGKIVGGFLANITQVPWQAGLYKNGVQVCGGSIIGSRWILTGAYCLDKFNHRRHQIRVGSADKFWGGTEYSIESHRVHEQFDVDTIDYDFGLLRLKEEIQFNERIQPVQLANADDDDVATGTMCLVSGWGATLNNSESDRYLRAVEIPTVDHDLCNEIYEGLVTSTMLCAGYVEEGGKNACLGDSGGPMVVFSDKTKLPIQIGTVSWSDGCAEPGNPGVFGKVAAAREWIFRQTGI